MIFEYILLLFASLIILLASFSASRGPVRMFKNSAPILGAKVEKRLMTGEGFCWLETACDWKR